jgi:AAA domain
MDRSWQGGEDRAAYGGAMKDWDAAHRAGANAREAADAAWTPEPKTNGKAESRLIIPSHEFVAGYVAPEFLIEGIFQRRRIFSLTGKTGDGKTALQLFFAYLLATGTKLGHRQVEKCRVLYLAGENPDDVRGRWLAMGDDLGFDPIDVHFVEGVFKISELLERVHQEAGELGGFGAVIVDTSAAFFEGDEENDNVQLGNHARLLRKLSALPGEPGVLVGCHPTKSGDILLPRGGGAFLAEVDGNLTCKKTSDEVIEFHWCGKFRGASFEPVLFEISTVMSERVKDANGNSSRVSPFAS